MAARGAVNGRGGVVVVDEDELEDEELEDEDELEDEELEDEDELEE